MDPIPSLLSEYLVLCALCLAQVPTGKASPVQAEMVETTFGIPKKRWIVVISCLIYFCFLMSFLVVSLKECRFLELTFVSGAD